MRSMSASQARTLLHSGRKRGRQVSQEDAQRRYERRATVIKLLQGTKSFKCKQNGWPMSQGTGEREGQHELYDNRHGVRTAACVRDPSEGRRRSINMSWGVWIGGGGEAVCRQGSRCKLRCLPARSAWQEKARGCLMCGRKIRWAAFPSPSSGFRCGVRSRQLFFVWAFWVFYPTT